MIVAGTPAVRDPLATLTRNRAADGDLERHAESFFQGNRYLLSELVTAVLDAVPTDEAVLDLYAGVGLFSVALAAAGHAADITAVEGDRSARSGPETQRATVREAAPARRQCRGCARGQARSSGPDHDRRPSKDGTVQAGE